MGRERGGGMKVGALGTLVVCLLSARLTVGQTVAEQKPLMAEKAFKNVQVLKGISVNQFMATMGFFSASLGMTCTDCHGLESAGSWEKYADDTDRKKTTRSMIVMASAINKAYFGGRREITCYSCHRGVERPKVTPSLAELYGPPSPPDEPDQLLEPAAKAPSVDQILDKYFQALGGVQRLAGLASFVAKGTFEGYGEEKEPVEVFAKAPNQRAMIVHAPAGDTTSTYDGRTGWISAPAIDRPVPMFELSGSDLDDARLDAELDFPARLKQSLSQWRVANPATIDDHEAQVIQGSSDGRRPVNLYFDSKSGLLVRLVRYTDSPVGLNPTQIDYADYRDVAGVKIPFRSTVTWLDGRTTVTLSDVQPNVPIDAAKFAKPAPSAPPK
jgi:photosynthetic reaction center cytochrome c subunit